MKTIYPLIALFFALTGNALAQCTLTNATSCVCDTPGSTDCDLLPDMMVAQPPLLINGSSGVVEYSQVGNGSNDGRLRLSVSTPNIGRGPLEVRGSNVYVCGVDTFYGTPPASCPNTGLPPTQLLKQRVYHKTGNVMSYYDRDAGTMTFHPTHGHQHVDEWGEFTLRTATLDPNPLNWPIIGSGAKVSFCLLDLSNCTSSAGHCVDSTGTILNSSNIPNYGLGGGNYGCSQTVQGISAGYVDIYNQSLDGMYVTIPPGTCNGQYYIVVQLDPNDYFLESNENNNVIAVPYTLTKQAGTVPLISVTGSTSLCPGQSVTLTSSPAPTYLWSNGATTQSITVNQPGNYSVTTDVNTTCPASSAPMTVTVQNMPVTVTPTAATVCNGDSSTLNTTVTTPPTGTVQTSFGNSTVIAIPDNIPTGIVSPVTVSGINPTTLGANSIFSVQVNITHTYDGDLIVALIAPSGNVINLSNRRGGGGDNFNNTIFSMTAATPIAGGSAPFNGSYIPDGAFSSLTGNANGTWQLRVSDHAGVDIGTLNSWTITFYNVVSTQLAYSWTSSPSGFTSADANPVVNPAQTTTYTVVATNLITGCSGTQSATVTVNPLPVLSFPPPAPVCAGTAAFTLSGATPAGGTYSGTGVSNGVFDPVAAGVGTHALQYSYTDGNGCSSTETASITVNTLPLVSLGSYSAICDTSSAIALSGGLPAGGTFSGPGVSNNQFDPGVAGVGTHVIVYSFTDVNGCSSSASASITVNDCSCTLPATPTNMQGPTKPCPGNSYTYSVVNVAGVTYNWTVPVNATVTNGQGTNAVTVSFASNFTSGKVCLNAVNACGPSAARCKSVSRNIPATPSTIQGNTGGFCQSTQTLTINPVTGAFSYNWTLPTGTTYISGQGTTSLTFSTDPGFISGSICVNANNGCMNGNNRCATIYTTPNKPVISGPSTVCANQQGVAFSVAPVIGATSYVWGKPSTATIATGQGTTDITVNFGATAGNITCQAWNACGKRGTSTKAVSFNCREANAIDADLFPNPAHEQVTLVLRTEQRGKAGIEILDLTGRSIGKHDLDLHEGENTFDLDVRHYSAGVYFVNICRAGGTSRIRFVVE